MVPDLSNSGKGRCRELKRRRGKPTVQLAAILGAALLASGMDLNDPNDADGNSNGHYGSGNAGPRRRGLVLGAEAATSGTSSSSGTFVKLATTTAAKPDPVTTTTTSTITVTAAKVETTPLDAKVETTPAAESSPLPATTKSSPPAVAETTTTKEPVETTAAAPAPSSSYASPAPEPKTTTPAPVPPPTSTTTAKLETMDAEPPKVETIDAVSAPSATEPAETTPAPAPEPSTSSEAPVMTAPSTAPPDEETKTDSSVDTSPAPAPTEPPTESPNPISEPTATPSAPTTSDVLPRTGTELMPAEPTATMDDERPATRTGGVAESSAPVPDATSDVLPRTGTELMPAEPTVVLTMDDERPATRTAGLVESSGAAAESTALVGQSTDALPRTATVSLPNEPSATMDDERPATRSAGVAESTGVGLETSPAATETPRMGNMTDDEVVVTRRPGGVEASGTVVLPSGAVAIRTSAALVGTSSVRVPRPGTGTMVREGPVVTVTRTMTTTVPAPIAATVSAPAVPIASQSVIDDMLASKASEAMAMPTRAAAPGSSDELAPPDNPVPNTSSTVPPKFVVIIPTVPAPTDVPVYADPPPPLEPAKPTRIRVPGQTYDSSDPSVDYEFSMQETGTGNTPMTVVIAMIGFAAVTIAVVVGILVWRRKNRKEEGRRVMAEENFGRLTRSRSFRDGNIPDAQPEMTEVVESDAGSTLSDGSGDALVAVPKVAAMFKGKGKFLPSPIQTSGMLQRTNSFGPSARTLTPTGTELSPTHTIPRQIPIDSPAKKAKVVKFSNFAEVGRAIGPMSAGVLRSSLRPVLSRTSSGTVSRSSPPASPVNLKPTGKIYLPSSRASIHSDIYTPSLVSSVDDASMVSGPSAMSVRDVQMGGDGKMLVSLVSGVDRGVLEAVVEGADGESEMEEYLEARSELDVEESGSAGRASPHLDVDR